MAIRFPNLETTRPGAAGTQSNLSRRLETSKAVASLWQLKSKSFGFEQVTGRFGKEHTVGLIVIK